MIALNFQRHWYLIKVENLKALKKGANHIPTITNESPPQPHRKAEVNRSYVGDEWALCLLILCKHETTPTTLDVIKRKAKCWYLKRTIETTKSFSKQHRICPIHGSQTPSFSTIPFFCFINNINFFIYKVYIVCLHFLLNIFNSLLLEKLYYIFH